GRRGAPYTVDCIDVTAVDLYGVAAQPLVEHLRRELARPAAVRRDGRRDVVADRQMVHAVADVVHVARVRVVGLVDAAHRPVRVQLVDLQDRLVLRVGGLFDRGHEDPAVPPLVARAGAGAVGARGDLEGTHDVDRGGVGTGGPDVARLLRWQAVGEDVPHL